MCHQQPGSYRPDLSETKRRAIRKAFLKSTFLDFAGFEHILREGGENSLFLQRKTKRQHTAKAVLGVNGFRPAALPACFDPI